MDIARVLGVQRPFVVPPQARELVPSTLPLTAIALGAAGLSSGSVCGDVILLWREQRVVHPHRARLTGVSCVRGERVPALARVSLFHVHGLLRCQPVSFVKAVPAFAEEILVAHDFPAFKKDVGFADDLPTTIAGDDERSPLTIVATISDVHHIPSRSKNLVGAGLVSDRGFQFGCCHFSQNSTASTAAPPQRGGLIWKSR